MSERATITIIVVDQATPVIEQIRVDLHDAWCPPGPIDDCPHCTPGDLDAPEERRQ